MAKPIFPLNRRRLIAGLGAVAVCPFLPGGAAAGEPRRAVLTADADTLALRPGQPGTPVWVLKATERLRARRGDSLEITFRNNLPVPAALNWRGLDGAAAVEPFTARRPTPPGAEERLIVPLPCAGTLICDLHLLDTNETRPLRPLALVVEESASIAVDREEILLIEDFRLRPDGSAVALGGDPAGTAPVYAVSGRISPEISGRTNERLRFRIINGCQRSVVALKFENRDVRVMALDSRPAEPFFARNGALVLPPGGRADALVDIAAAQGVSPILLHDGTEPRPIAHLTVSSEPPMRPAPLAPAPPFPADGLPARLDLKNALRVDLPLGEPQSDWTLPKSFANSSRPAFRAKAGRTVVLALANRAATPTVFHLHGHHFRLLDRLDDGWKPYWLDTLAVEGGQTARIAYLAEHPGRWLMEQAATDWAAPRLLRWYSVE